MTNEYPFLKAMCNRYNVKVISVDDVANSCDFTGTEPAINVEFYSAIKTVFDTRYRDYFISIPLLETEPSQVKLAITLGLIPVNPQANLKYLYDLVDELTKESI